MTTIEKSVFDWCEQLLQASANITNTNSNMNLNKNLTAQFSSLLAMVNPNMTMTPVAISNGLTPPAQINHQYLSTCDQNYLHCQLCGQTLYDITCSKGHEFQRCNKTFLYRVVLNVVHYVIFMSMIRLLMNEHNYEH